MVNETNILNLIAKSPDKPEPSFQVSHLEQSDHQRFDRVLEARVESHHDEPFRAASQSNEARENPAPRESRNPAPVSQNEMTPAAHPDHQHQDTPPATPASERRGPAPLHNETHGNSDAPHSIANHSADQAPVNPFALPVKTLLENLNPADDASGLVDHPNQSATDILAGLFEAHGLSEEGSHAIDTLRELLAGLNIDSATIDLLVSALQNGDAAGVHGILHALRGLLTASNQAAQAPLANHVLDVAAGRLNQPEQRVIDLLVRAGLTRQEAQQVIQQMRAAGTPQPLNENTAQPAKTAAEGIVAKPQTANQPGSGNLQNSSGDSKGSTGHSAEAHRSVSGLAGERLATLASLVAPDKSSNTGNAQTNPLINKAATSPLQNLNASGQPVQSILGEGAPGQSPAAMTDAAARAVDLVKPAVTETYNGRASMDKPITAQIIEKFTLRGFGNQREVHIKLDPPSLGTVRMNVSISGETVRATIVVENNIVKLMIESNLSQLKDAITHQGVKIDSFNVLVGGNASQSAHGHKDALDYLAQLGQEGPLAHESAEASIVLHRPVFMDENQSISIFA